MLTKKFVSGLLCLGLLFTFGCGGSEAPSTEGAADNSQPSTADSVEAEEMDMAAEMATTESAGSDSSDGSDSSGSDSSGGNSSGGDSSGGETLADSDDESMLSAMTEEGSGLSSGFPQTPRKPPRPDKLTDWTPEHVADAIIESDAKAVSAVEAFAVKTKGNAGAVEQLKAWVDVFSKKPGGAVGTTGGDFASSGSSEEGMVMEEDPAAAFGGGSGAPDFNRKMTESLLTALSTNGTREAYTTLASVVTGQVDFGGTQEKAIETAVVTLLTNVANPNNPSGDLLFKAIQSVQLDGINAPPEKGEPGNVSLDNRAKELHLGFAIAAMNGLMGVKLAPGKPNSNNGFGGFGSSGLGGEEFGMEAMNLEPGGVPDGFGNENALPKPAHAALPVRVAPIALNRAEAEAVLTYFWSKEMLDYATAQLIAHPDSAEAFIFASAFPTAETRTAVQGALTAHQFRTPQAWLHASVLSGQLADPALHLLIKSLPREQRETVGSPGGGEGSGGGSRVNRKSTKEKDADPEALARKEARYGWMDASEKSLVSLLERMYQGSMNLGSKPFEQSELTIPVHKGGDVTASLRFALPDPESKISELSAAQMTRVNYVRIESNEMNSRTVQHYRNALRDKEVVTILNGNGMWLDGTIKPNRKDDTLRSVDILLSKSGARPSLKPGRTGSPAFGGSSEGEFGLSDEGNGGGGGGGSFVVEILVVEAPPLATAAEATEVSATDAK